MTELEVSAVNSYLADAGWFRTEQSWHGAAIWSNGHDEVLVPPRDGMGDTLRRLRELLAALQSIESRPASDIARDIAYPLLDSASYRTSTGAHPAGFVPLSVGLGAVQGVHDMFREAAWTVLNAPDFPGGTNDAVSDLLSGVHLGTTIAQQFALTLLVPLEISDRQGPVPLGRQVLLQMQVATLAVRQIVGTTNPADLEEAAAVGVTADFCRALSTLAGNQFQEPFELRFRWARAVHSEQPDQALEFPTGAGELIREASRLLEPELQRPAAAAPELTGAATISGLIEDLHDNRRGGDRWRVKVRGELWVDGRRSTRRVIWIRLAGRDSYDVALSAHRDHTPVRIDGSWSAATRGTPMIADPDGLRILGEPQT
jgi:hypothetical protein